MNDFGIRRPAESKNRCAPILQAGLLFLLAIGFPNPGFSWQGIVVDRQTGKPVAGVAIVRTWHRFIAGPMGGVTHHIGSKEGVSGADGRISVPWLLYFPGIPRFAWAEENPVTVYKPGYKFQLLRLLGDRVELERVPTTLGARRKEWREASNTYLPHRDVRQGGARMLERFWGIKEREYEFLHLLESVTDPKLPPPPVTLPPPQAPKIPSAGQGAGLSLVTPNVKAAPGPKAHARGKGKDAFERRLGSLWCGKDRPLNSMCSFDSLCSVLADKGEHPLRRAMAADLLGHSGDPRASSPLLQAAKDEHPSVRAAAVGGLGYLKDPRSVELLIHSLADSDRAVQHRAGGALALLGTSAVEPLIRALADKDRGPQAASVLGGTGDARVVAPLIAAFDAGDPKLSWAAGFALANFKDGKNAALYVKALRNKKHPFHDDAASALVRNGKTSTNAVIPLLKDGDPELRARAAMILGSLKDTEATSPLIPCLKDPDATLRCRAAESLGHLGDPRAIPHLAGILDDEESSVRITAWEALTSIGKPALPTLASALRGPNPYFRWRAAWCMGRIGDPSATDALIDALRDENPEVRWTGVAAIGRLGDRKAAGPLSDMCADDDLGIRELAGAVLRKLGGAAECPQDERNRREVR